MPLTNGRLENFSGMSEGTSMTFQCDEGYFPTNKTTVTCTDGNWLPLPQCNRTDNITTTPNTSIYNYFTYSIIISFIVIAPSHRDLIISSTVSGLLVVLLAFTVILCVICLKYGHKHSSSKSGIVCTNYN